MIEKRKNRPSLKFILSVFIGSALASGVVIFSILYFLLEPEPPQPLYLQGNPDGVRELSTPRELIDFTLPSSTGEDVSLSDFQDASVLLFFGYTYCPDICPLTLSHVRQAHELLGDRADGVKFVYITVDPARDTVERLAEYFIPFRVADFTVGLVGDDLTLQRISADYSLYYQLNNEDDSSTYSVDHTASIYFINTEGQLDTIFSYGTRPETIVEHILDKMP
ncbi:MAG: SCO family protein [Phototrophicaceae bacterium]